MKENSQVNPSTPGSFTVTISDESFSERSFRLSDQKVTGHQIVEAFGKRPVEEFVVLQRLGNGDLETLRPTELVDLGANGAERFFVIKGSLTYRFTVDGASMEWPLASILGRHIKELASADKDDELVLDRSDGDIVVGDETPVKLDKEGVEHLKTRKRPQLVNVTYNHQSFQLEPRVYSTEELLTKFSVPEGYKLDEVRGKGELHELKPGEQVHIREGMEFTSHPPRGQSS